MGKGTVPKLSEYEIRKDIKKIGRVEDRMGCKEVLLQE